MGSSTKRQQTMAKMARERALREKRARKQEKREEKKLAAAAAQGAEDGVDAEADELGDAVAGEEAADA
jgi:hypothetical protein